MDCWEEYAEWANGKGPYPGAASYRAARNLAFGLAIVAAYIRGRRDERALPWSKRSPDAPDLPVEVVVHASPTAQSFAIVKTPDGWRIEKDWP